ncbi:MAG TPA: YceI family protein [Patescibacteria group bacterium]|nr:YceI family protein [Patescibacteria group bacterium]
MNKKITIGVIALIIVAAVAYITTRQTSAPSTTSTEPALSATNMEQESMSSMDHTTMSKTPLTGSGTYVFDVNESSFTWEGKKPLISNYVDTGTVKIKQGQAEVRDGKLVGGSAVVDLTTISATQTGKGSGNEMLQKHIMSSDFFDTTKFPEATFAITSATQDPSDPTKYTVQGDLKIKDVSEKVTFDATLTQEADGDALFHARTSLDRTKWGLKYGSGSFFKDLGDKVIDDLFSVEFKVHATLQK